jgi:hypothetical protein
MASPVSFAEITARIAAMMTALLLIHDGREHRSACTISDQRRDVLALSHALGND